MSGFQLQRGCIITAPKCVVLQRGKVPIVVGGTGFYLRWFIHGKPQTPASTPEGAATVSRFLEQVGLICKTLHASCATETVDLQQMEQCIAVAHR